MCSLLHNPGYHVGLLLKVGGGPGVGGQRKARSKGDRVRGMEGEWVTLSTPTNFKMLYCWCH